MKKLRKDYVFIFILLIIFVLLTAFVLQGKMDIVDENFFKGVIKIENKPLTSVLRIITDLASTIGIITLLVVTGLIFLKHKALSDFKYVVINVFSGVVLVTILKNVVGRIRPAWKWIEQGGFSYPSGHTISAFMLYGTLMLLVYKKVHGKLRKPLLIGFSLVIFLTGFSRIYFGAHYLTDVLASLILGCIILIISNMFMNKEFNNDKNKNRKAVQTK